MDTVTNLFILLFVILFHFLQLTFYFSLTPKKAPFTLLISLLILKLFLAILTVFDLSYLTFLLKFLFSFLFFPSISYFFIEKRYKYLTVFYGLFPVVWLTIITRFVRFVCLYLSDYREALWDQPLYSLIINYIGLLVAFLVIKQMKFHFQHMPALRFQSPIKALLKKFNTSMEIYIVSTGTLSILNFLYELDTLKYMYLIVFFYFFLFFSFNASLENLIKEGIQSELDFQKDIQIQSLQSYSGEIEKINFRLKSFRHDYINMVSTLDIAIKNKDLHAIEEIYTHVIQEYGKQLNYNRYDLSKLINIDNSALKSLLFVKYSEAESKGIRFHFDIPEEISPEGIELVDLLTICSVYLDNAIEASQLAEEPRIIFSSFKEDPNRVIYSIENSTAEEKINTKPIFDSGFSSKGPEHGLGLSIVARILTRYPNIERHTSSKDHIFSQIIEITADDDE